MNRGSEVKVNMQFNTFKPTQNGRHFVDIFKCVSLKLLLCISLIFHGRLHQGIPLTVLQWFRELLGPDQTRSHCPNQSGWIPWWRHQMETFSALLAICAGNSPVTVNSSHKGQWRGALMFSLKCAWINGWVNNREAGDLRGHPTHYDVTVMSLM